MPPNISRSKNNQNKSNDIWSVNRKRYEKYFSSKIMWKIRQGDKFHNSFCFFKTALYEIKTSGQYLSFNTF